VETLYEAWVLMKTGQLIEILDRSSKPLRSTKRSEVETAVRLMSDSRGVKKVYVREIRTILELDGPAEP